MFKIQHALLLGAVLFASGAYGQDEKRQGGVSQDLENEFKAMDRDGDGYLSSDEFSGNKAMAAGLQGADKNGDGKLDMAEFQSLEANASRDRSLGSVPAGQEPASSAGGTAPKPEGSK